MSYPTLIVFEGVDGVGKSTQVNMLAESLRSMGHRVLVRNAPSHDLPLGKLIRTNILSEMDEAKRPSLMVQGIVQLAGLREIAEASIPQIRQVDYVLFDRWYYTTLAYNAKNAYERGTLGIMVSAALFENLVENDPERYEWDEFFTIPAAVVFLNGEIETIAQRLANRSGETHAFDKSSQEEIACRQENYADVFSEEVNSQVIDYFVDTETPQEIHAALVQHLLEQGIIKED